MEFAPGTWKIFYGDGSTFSNEDGLPEQAPCTGVLAVAFFNMDNRREIGASKDYYWYDETPIYQTLKTGTWFAGDVVGFYQYMFRPGKKIVKFGAVVHDTIWRKQLEKIIAEFPEALDYRIQLPQ